VVVSGDHPVAFEAAGRPALNRFPTDLFERLFNIAELPTGSGTIPVVEDDSFVRGYAAASLETLDYRVVIATNGREAQSFLF
jgi:hypothetical protein